MNNNGGRARPSPLSAPQPAARQNTLAGTGARTKPVREAADQTKEAFEADVDAAVDSLLDTVTPRKTDAAEEAADRRSVAETFSDVVKTHARPIRELMFQLSLGRTPRSWAAACRPVLRPLLDAANQIPLPEWAAPLERFDAALARAGAQASNHIDEDVCGALREAYGELSALLPEAFSAPTAADNRSLVLFESLLLQIPSLHRRTLGKLHRAGLSSLSQLSDAKPDEIAAVAGIDHDLSQTIASHVARFERERGQVSPPELRDHLQKRMQATIARLAKLQAEFQRAEQQDDAERKRTARRSREAAVLELDVLFAQAGDVRVIEELKRSPVDTKIRHVESYLERQKAAAPQQV